MSSDLEVGTAEVCITPPADCQLVHRKADGIHDDIYARTLAFGLDGERAAIVGLDLISLGKDQTSRIKARAAKLCGIKPHAVMLCCSHTHSGPTTNYLRGWGHGDPEYHARMIESIAQCIAAAFVNRAPAELACGECPLQIGHNRRLDHDSGSAIMTRNPDGPIDKRIRVLRVTDRKTGAVRAVLFSHGCHPVVIHCNTTKVSADYPGRAAAYLKERFGPDMCPVFAQGCGADANTEVLNGTFDDLDRIGSLVACAAEEATRRARPIKCDRLRPMMTTVRMPTRIPTKEEAEKALELNKAALQKLIEENNASAIEEFRECGVGWAEDLVRVANSPDEDHRIQMDITALVLGDELCIVGLEAEVFHRYHDICRSVSPCANTIVFGGVGGSVCYLPTADEFLRGGYEIAGKDYADTGGYAYKRYGTLAFTPGCEDAVREGVRDLLREAWRGESRSQLAKSYNERLSGLHIS